MSHKPFSGVITAIVTPFEKNGELDLNSFNKLIEFQKKSGINGIVVLGTTGENPTLNDQECVKLIQNALDHRSDDFHIYVGSGTNDLKQTIHKSKTYSQITVGKHKPDGIMVVTPYYNKPSAQHLVYYYNEVFQSIHDVPVCIYNVPGRTGINMTANTLVKIVEQNKNVCAIKEAAGNVNAIAQMRIELNAINRQDIQILSGDDATYAPSLICGANGVISVTTNLIPKPMIAILNAFKKGDFQEVQRLHLSIFCINSGIFCVSNPVGIKWMLSRFNLCDNYLRAPLYPAEPFEEEQLKGILECLEKAQII